MPYNTFGPRTAQGPRPGQQRFGEPAAMPGFGRPAGAAPVPTVSDIQRAQAATGATIPAVRPGGGAYPTPGGGGLIPAGGGGVQAAAPQPVMPAVGRPGIANVGMAQPPAAGPGTFAGARPVGGK